MKKLLILLTILLLSYSLVGCKSESEVVSINVENSQDLNGTIFGEGTLIYIGSGLWYDSTTRIVYWWNGYIQSSQYDTTPSPYYAPNGLPYKYNSETNTFEEIDLSEAK